MHALSCFFLVATSLWYSLGAWAQLDVEDQIYDLEAQVKVLKSDLENVRALATQERGSAFNPSISVIGDLIGQYGFNLSHTPRDHGGDHGHDHDHGNAHRDHGGHHGNAHHDHAAFENGVLLREVEFEFRGDIDPFADALVTFGIHPHAPSSAVHLEEAYVRLKAWPGLGYAPLGMIIKAGKFRTAFGRMNRLHLHNTPQITYPLSTRIFLGDEGHAAGGVSVNVSFNPSVKSAISLFAEAIFLSHAPLQPKKGEKIPSGVFHAWWHQELAPAHFLDIGASGLLGRNGGEKSGLFFMAGSDVHYSYIPTGYGQNPIFLFGNELYVASRREETNYVPVGNYTWAQVRLFGSTFFGVRYDFAPNDEFNGLQHELGGYFSHYTTEFMRIRLGYEHGMKDIRSFDGDHRFMLSLMFVLGNHPIEPYFINR